MEEIPGYERKVVKWFYTYHNDFDMLGQNENGHNNVGANGENYTAEDIEEGSILSINEFESDSMPNGKQEIVQKGDYTFIGPYNFTIKGGKISEISIKTSNTETINAGPNDNTIYVSIDGEHIIGMDQIKENADLAYTNYSGDSFYIVYKGKISRTEEIKIKRTKEGYRARLVTIESIVFGQNNIVFDGAPAKEETYLYLPGAKTHDAEFRIKKIDKSGDGQVNGIGFKVYSQIEGKKGWLKIGTDKKIEGYTTDFREATELSTNARGLTDTIKNIPVGKYSIYETNLGPHSKVYVLENINVPGSNEPKKAKKIGDYEILVNASATIEAENTPELGSLQIKKVDKDTGEILQGIGFKIYSKIKGKVGWLRINSNNELEGYTSFAEATELKTNAEGFTDKIINLPKGEYDVYETSLGDYIHRYKLKKINDPGEGKTYEAKRIDTVTVQANGKSNPLICNFANTRDLVKLSGYVFKDIQSQKQTIRNDLYKEKENDNDNTDDEDQLLKGIVVRLKYIDKDKEIDKEIAKTRTNAEGKYVFEDVEISKLADYSIEFDYYGLIYENVELHLDKYNGSKATEGDLRTEFNNKFTEITKDTIIDDIELKYNKGGHKSTLNNANMFIITSTTKNAKLNLEQVYQNQNKKDEIENINLGLYEREQPDLAVMKDIENVKVTVNGYEHTYKYSSRFLNAGDYLKDGFNVGVKFGEKYGDASYSRPVYKSDYDYENEDEDKKLKTYITYKIAIGNLATGLTSKVNSLVDYYDSRYELVAAGTELNETNGNIEGTTIKWSKEDSFYQGYKKAVLNTDGMTIDGLKVKYIYVKFSLNREAIKSIFFDANGKEVNEKILLDNIAEINSYATYKNDELYAGVDKNSRPGNAEPDKKDEFENDTGAAPALKLEAAEARKITGTVFEDSVKGEIKAGEERLGNGMYDEGEKTIQGVEVRLVKEDGSVEKSTVTDEKGNFELEGFIPGKYTLVYIWGDETYPVEDYKGTIIKDKDRFNSISWYAQNVDTRYSDAIDNYDIRTKIDSGEHPEIKKMDSITPEMEFGIEKYGTLTNVSEVDKLQFLIKNIDFGIVERPRQKLDISKEVTAMKTTVGDNIVLVDVVKDGNGEYVPKVVGSKMNFTAPRPEDPTQKTTIKEEIDDDILNNATVQIEYTIKVTNNSELDYNTEDYYIYGVHGENDKANEVLLKPTGVYDYLDKKMALDPDNKGEWKVVSKEDYLNETTKETDPVIIDEYMINSVSTYNNPDGSKIEIRDFISYVKEYYEVIEEWEHRVFKEFRKNMAMDRTILRNSNLEESLQAGKSNEAKLYTSTKLAATADNINFNNSVEITKVENNTTNGRKITPRTSKLFDPGQEVIITPPTGKDHDYVLPIALGVSLLAILGAGVILIKKKVLNK